MAKIESEIKLEEKVDNDGRVFGSAREYFPCYITSENSEPVPALLTKSQIRVAIERAKKNMEDVPEKDGGGFFSFLFG